MELVLQTPNSCSGTRVWHFSCFTGALLGRFGVCSAEVGFILGDWPRLLPQWFLLWSQRITLLGWSWRDPAFLPYLPPAWVMLSEISPYLLAQLSQKPSPGFFFQLHVQKFHLCFLAHPERFLRTNLISWGIGCSFKDVDFQEVWRQCPQETLRLVYSAHLFSFNVALQEHQGAVK